MTGTDLTLGLDEPQRPQNKVPRTTSYRCHGCQTVFVSGTKETSPFCPSCRPLTEQVCPRCGYIEARGRWCSSCKGKTGLADWRKPPRERP